MDNEFDRVIPRSGTSSFKYAGRMEFFGTDDVLPLWVADMDFAVPQAVRDALTARAAHPIYGYTVYPESLYEALIVWLQKRYAWMVEREWIVMCPGCLLYTSDAADE